MPRACAADGALNEARLVQHVVLRLDMFAAWLSHTAALCCFFWIAFVCVC
jgi:hypothetical protein